MVEELIKMRQYETITITANCLDLQKNENISHRKSNIAKQFVKLNIF